MALDARKTGLFGGGCETRTTLPSGQVAGLDRVDLPLLEHLDVLPLEGRDLFRDPSDEAGFRTVDVDGNVTFQLLEFLAEQRRREVSRDAREVFLDVGERRFGDDRLEIFRGVIDIPEMMRGASVVREGEREF